MTPKLILILIFIIIIYIIINLRKKNFENFYNYHKKNFKIDNYYVINLDKDTKRLKKFNIHAKKNNIKYTRFAAIYGKNLDENDFRLKKYFAKNLKNYSMAQKSCTLSHISIWEKIKQDKTTFNIIFEDDVIIPNNFNNKLKLYLEQLPKNWDILFLGGNRIVGKKYSKNLIKPTKDEFGNFGSFAYLINSKNINFILDKCKNISLYTDKFIQKELGGYLNLFFCNPQLIEHDYDNISNIFNRNRKNEQNINNKIKLL